MRTNSMFTGLITARGIVKKITAAEAEAGAKIVIGAPGEWLRDAKPGDSIAADGACLTAETIAADCFFATLSSETIACCAPWRQNAAVNLEYPLAVGDKLGGHFVSGHIDGIAQVKSAEKTADGGRRMVFTPPPPLMRFIVRKGSIALSGVSLTVNDTDARDFSVQIVPHTLSQTTLGNLAPGDKVNMETDLLARHLHKLAGGN